MSFGSLILVTMLLFFPNGQTEHIQMFVMPHSLEQSVSEKTIMDNLDGKLFNLNGIPAKVLRVNNMENWEKIGCVEIDNEKEEL